MSRNYELANEMVKYAKSFYGVQYRWGGDDTIEGFDCSGLVIECLQAVGMFPFGQDTDANGLYEYYVSRGTLPEVPAPGCLVFYFKNGRACHIGIYATMGLYITADGGRSTTLSAEVAAEQNAFVKLRPVSSRPEPIFVDPFEVNSD